MKDLDALEASIQQIHRDPTILDEEQLIRCISNAIAVGRADPEYQQRIAYLLVGLSQYDVVAQTDPGRDALSILHTMGELELPANQRQPGTVWPLTLSGTYFKEEK